MKRILFFITAMMLAGQIIGQQTVEGTILSEADGTSLPGVNVYNKSTTQGTVTDLDGHYSIVASVGDSLFFTFVGMEEKKLVFNGESLLNISLKTLSIELDELVLIGYGYQKKSVVTGAIASVKSEDIEKTSNLRVENALQGKVAGVQVTSSSGQPGEPLTVRVRGTGTTGNPDPLYIVDGFQTGSIDYLNPSDIESIEILKDAASASIYGARGANGVVLIRTKSGQKGKMQVTYNMYYGIQNPIKKLDLLNAKEYGILMNEAANNAGRPRIFDDPDSLGVGTDWQEEIFYRNAPIREHSLTVSGGSDQATYSSSFSYFNQDGIVGEDKSNFERYSFRLNTDQGLGRFSYGARIYYSQIRKRGIEPNLEFGQPLSSALNIDPVTPVKNEDGTWGESPYIAQEVVNPAAQLDIIHGKYKIDKMIGNIYGELEVFKNFKVKSNLGVDYAYDVNDNYQPAYRLNSSVRNEISSVGKTMNRYYTWNWENIISYFKSFNEHTVTALAGMSIMEHKGENLSGSKEGLLTNNPDQAYIDMAKNPDSERAGGGAWHSALMSYFGQVHYSFANTYLFTGTLRLDGSSKFGSENRYALFPSVSVGWVLSEEDFFFPSAEFVNFTKLRVSWGQNGNQEIGDYKYTSLIVSNSNYYWGEPSVLVNGAQPANIDNPEIKWETSEQINAGMDFRFFKNKLSFTFDWYNKKTKGLLVEAPIPGYIGNYPPTVNAGDVVNRGVELELGYKNHTGDFNYSISYNMSYNKNEVTYIGNAEGIIHGAGVGTTMTDVCRAEEGYPIAYFWGYEVEGVFQNYEEINAYNIDGTLIQPLARPGDFKFKDNNGDGQITDEDRVMIGNPNPDVFIGLNLGAEYKRFDLNLFFQGAFGHQLFYGVRRNDLNMANYDSEMWNRWLGEGSTNDYPRVTLNDQNGNLSKPSDYYVYDASYLRLKNIQLGYSFPIQFGKVLIVKKARIWLAAQNILTFTKYKGFDPEVGARPREDNVRSNPLDVGIDRGVYPQAWTVMVGANINF
ncbi:MAG: TonB-dependent receptor [Bacteroidales bacterium]|nr:TonB-dependent receptor [Bacteroidales bacterium]